MKTVWSKDAIGQPINMAKVPADVEVVDNPVGNIGNATVDLSALVVVKVATVSGVLQ